jgi:hypothetical protein
MKLAYVFVTLVLAACSMAAISDRYGNEYGGWYNPGADYRWQLELCEHQVEARDTPLAQRKLALRCCMQAHGVPITDPQDCRA